MGDVSARLTREQRQLAELLLRKRGLDPAQLPIPRRPDPTRAPLSVTQRRLWASGRAAGGSAYGNVPMAVRIRGPVEIDALACAISLVVERHEILRTTFPLEDGEPVQRIHPSAPVHVAVEDLRTVHEREMRFESRVEEESRRPFDPATETMLRATAFRLDEADLGLVLVSHHLATDGWGARLLLDELTSAYRALVEHREPELPMLPAQYADFAAWEVERVESGALEQQRRHWMERLAGAPLQLALPFERTDSGSVETDSIEVALAEELARELRALSRARGVTPYVVLLAALEVALHRCTGQGDVVTGTILSRRTRSETEPLIGNFGNNLLLRTQLGGDPSLAEVVDRTAATVRDAFAHSEVPLELVAQTMPIPAFNTMFIVRDGGLEERLALPGTSVEAVRASSGAATLDLIVDLTDHARGIHGHFDYRRTRLSAETVRRLAHAFEDVVRRLVREPGARLSALPRLEVMRSAAEDERPRAVGEAPATRTERVLARLWSSVLEVETVYRDDRFFALGGDSLRAVYVLEQAEKELGHRLRPDELSRATLAQLADLCDGRAVALASCADPRESAATVRRVDPLRFGDRIKELFEREGMPHLVEFFDRTYPDAVREGAGSWVALDENERVVGHMAMFPHRFTYGTTQYTGGLGANLVMDRRHRNLTGAMALVQRMVSDLEERQDVDFLFGDPNDAAQSVMSSVGGMTNVDEITRYVLPVGGTGIADPAASLYLSMTLGRGREEPIGMERRSARAFDAREVERPPGEAPLLRPIRSPELYRRRLDGYPSEQDDWYLFTSEGERVAAILVRRLDGGDRVHLCSIWRAPDIALGRLLRPLVADLRREGAARLQALTLDSSPLGRELRAAGFRARERIARFGTMACSPRGRALLEQDVEWEITDLDCDRGVER